MAHGATEAKDTTVHLWSIPVFKIKWVLILLPVQLLQRLWLLLLRNRVIDPDTCDFMYLCCHCVVAFRACALYATLLRPQSFQGGFMPLVSWRKDSLLLLVQTWLQFSGLTVCNRRAWDEQRALDVFWLAMSPISKRWGLAEQQEKHVSS